MRTALALVVWLAATAPVMAQSDAFEQERRRAEGLEVNGVAPFAGLSLRAQLSRSWTVATFHVVWRGQSPDRRAHWLVRRVEGRGDEAQAVQWADSRTCQAATDLIHAMEQDLNLFMDAPGGGREDQRLGLVLDGVDVRFWTRAARLQPSGAVARLELSGNVNTPAYDWWAEAQAGLEPCWRDQPPP